MTNKFVMSALALAILSSTSAVALAQSNSSNPDMAPQTGQVFSPGTNDRGSSTTGSMSRPDDPDGNSSNPSEAPTLRSGGNARTDNPTRSRIETR